jgi:hypothetical protein
MFYALWQVLTQNKIFVNASVLNRYEFGLGI